MWSSLLLARLDSEYSREEGVSIVDGAPPVHLAVLLDNRVARVSQPALPERLLVHVSIHQHTVLVVLCISWLHIHDQEGASTGVFQGGDSRALEVLRFREGF